MSEGDGGAYCRVCARARGARRLRSFSPRSPAADRLLALVRVARAHIRRADGLPQGVCARCRRRLRATRAFLRRVRDAQASLARRLRVALRPPPAGSTASGSDSSPDEYLSSKSDTLRRLAHLKDDDSEDETSLMHFKDLEKVTLKEIDTKDLEEIKSDVGMHLELEPLIEIKIKKENTDSNNDDTNQTLLELDQKPLFNPLYTGMNTFENYEQPYPTTSAYNTVCNPDLTENFQNSKTTLVESQQKCVMSNVPTTSKMSVKEIKKDLKKRGIKVIKGKLEGITKGKRGRPRKARNTLLTPTKTDDPSLHRWSDFWCCVRCDKEYSTVDRLRNHSLNTHNKCIVFKCMTCSKRVYKFKAFLRHMIRHYDNLKQCCEFCNDCFVSAPDVIMHKKMDHADQVKSHHCVKCGTGFDNAVDLKCHRDSYTTVILKNAEDKQFICDHCGRVFPIKFDLSLHMANHYPSNLSCKICKKPFKNKYILSQHESTVHDPQLRYICQICGKALKKKTSLKEHILIHQGYKPFSCSICGKNFRANYQLKSHLLSHGGPKQFGCSLCGKEFRHLASFKTHLSTHYNERKYACDICPKDFNSWSNFNKHMKRIHDKNMAKERVKQDDVGIPEYNDVAYSIPQSDISSVGLPENSAD